MGPPPRGPPTWSRRELGSVGAQPRPGEQGTHKVPLAQVLAEGGPVSSRRRGEAGAYLRDGRWGGAAGRETDAARQERDRSSAESRTSEWGRPLAGRPASAAEPIASRAKLLFAPDIRHFGPFGAAPKNKRMCAFFPSSALSREYAKVTERAYTNRAWPATTFLWPNIQHRYTYNSI